MSPDAPADVLKSFKNVSEKNKQNLLPYLYKSLIEGLQGIKVIQLQELKPAVKSLRFTRVISSHA